MKQIEILFNEETGEVKLEAFGYQGKICIEDMKFLVDALKEPGTEEEVEYKAEYQLKNSEENRAWKKKTGVSMEKLCG